MLTITDLWVYPVKSLSGTHLERAEITPEGSLRYDREWLIVDDAGRMMWQGDLPRLTLLKVAMDEATLTILRPDGDAVAVALQHDGAAINVTQYGVWFRGVDAGDAVAALVSDWLKHPCRLVRIGDAAHRWPLVNLLHVLTRASLMALNERLALRGHPPMDQERFRANVLLDGARPFQEERQALVDFGMAQLKLVKPAIRCELVNISIHSAERERQPLRTSAAMSRERSTARKGSFGVYSSAAGKELVCGLQASADPDP